ncbi:Glucose-6-phosphate 1-dehydrogenase [Naganishia albida]|nr:Glucose-6-phosphate 1-dehydrogenase [Naganishia albida]
MSVKSQGELKDKTLIVVFGASGDLAKKMTFPSLFGLFKDGFLPPKTHIVGYARSELERKDFEDRLVGGLDMDKESKDKVEKFKKISSYVQGAYDEDDAFQNLEKELQKMADKDFDGESNRVYYLAVPPSQFTSLADKLHKNNYKGTSNRLVIEKPFGKDSDSAKEMMDAITKDGWKQEEIYRIDHFIGDEMARGIMQLRFANEVLIDSLLNKDKVSSVLIELKETFGCEGRGGYFDEFGIIRDVLQNHSMQLLTFLAMDKPESLEEDHIRDEKVKVLQAIKPIENDEAVLGQYTGNGDKPGYLDDESVENKESKTATFGEIVLRIDNDRWRGVPFILKAGKAIEEDALRIVVQFKQSENSLYPSTDPNELVIELYEKKVYFKINSKKPTMDGGIVRPEMILNYETKFDGLDAPQPYEFVIREVLKGNQKSFVRQDELEEEWRIFTPLLHYSEGKSSDRPVEYKYGSNGPKESQEFEKKLGFVITKDGYELKKIDVSK